MTEEVFKLPESEILELKSSLAERQEILETISALIKYIEQWGTGTNRMIKLCREARLPALHFINLTDSFVVIFSRKEQKSSRVKLKSSGELNETQTKIIEYLKKNKEASTYELAKSLKITERTIQRNIKQISEIVHWTGASQKDPKGKYVLKKSE